jgi:SH3-like domain-containing protein
MRTTSMVPERKPSVRRCLRPALMLAFAVGTGAAISLAAGTAWAATTRPVASAVRQTNPPIIIPGPAPPDGSGSTSAPTQSNPTNTWRIADTNGVPARVRSAPSLTATIVMRLEPGTVVDPLNETATADGYQWRRISFGGATGWIATSLLLEPAAPARTTIYVVAAVGERGLNLRESPSTASAVLASLQEGGAVEVVAGPREAEGRQWLQVRTGPLTGWVIADAITQR